MVAATCNLLLVRAVNYLMAAKHEDLERRELTVHSGEINANTLEKSADLIGVVVVGTLKMLINRFGDNRVNRLATMRSQVTERELSRIGVFASQRHAVQNLGSCSRKLPVCDATKEVFERCVDEYCRSTEAVRL